MSVEQKQNFNIVRLLVAGGDEGEPHPDVALVCKWSELRLLALRSDPRAFASSYETESERSLAQWMQRLDNPKAAHFIAVSGQEETEGLQEADFKTQAYDRRHWLGSTVLLGPQKATADSKISVQTDAFGRMTSCEEPESSANGEARILFHLNGVFVHPKARGMGVGRAMMNKALAQAGIIADEMDARWSCSVLVDSENDQARRLYERAGFVLTGEEKYIQQPRALVEGEVTAAERIALRLEYNG